MGLGRRGAAQVGSESARVTRQTDLESKLQGGVLQRFPVWEKWRRSLTIFAELKPRISDLHWHARARAGALVAQLAITPGFITHSEIGGALQRGGVGAPCSGAPPAPTPPHC
jgi:hypothetical protein